MKFKHFACLVLIAAMAGITAAQDIVVKNDSMPDDLTGSTIITLQAYFTTDEEAQVWLTSPICGQIVAVHIVWASASGSSPASTEAEIGIFRPGMPRTFPTRSDFYLLQRAGVPGPGAIQARILNPVLVDPAVNAFPQLGNLNFISSLVPMAIPVAMNEEFVVSLRFANNHASACSNCPTVPIDIDGTCVPVVNSVRIPPVFPFDFDACVDLGVSADFLMRVIISPSGLDCNGNGVADNCDILDGTSLDTNTDDIPDECQGVTLSPSESTTLIPGGGSTSPTSYALVEIDNGSTTGTFDADEPAGFPSLGDGNFSAFTGTWLEITTDRADGEYQMRVSIPYILADLGGRPPLSVNLRFYNGTRWILAAAGNFANSVKFPVRKLGLRFSALGIVDIDPMTLSPDLGDYGVFWNTDTKKGFVWANIDHTTEFAAGVAACPTDLDENGEVDVVDLLALLAAWNTPAADIDGNGNTDVLDLLALLAAWGACG